MSLSPADLKQLQAAKNLLENPGLTAQLTSLLGTPIEYGLKKLPRKVNEKLGSVIEGALLKVARSATATLQENASGQPANRLHTLGAAVSGGVGGFFGPLAMLVEVPVTTGIIFRSIADIARSEGESIRDMDTLMACIEVFALGGKSASDDASESGYYAVRTA
ncbi:EcsC family protein, partial [Pseudomonas aeruginosa]